MVSPAWFATVGASSGFTAAAPAATTSEVLDASEPAGDARPSPQGAGRAGGVPWIVRLAESAVADVRTVAGAAEFLESAMPGVTVVRGLGLPGQLLVDVGITLAETADVGGLFAAVPGVAWAHPDFQIDASLTPNDPRYGSLYGLHNTGQSGGTPGADIDAAAAWDVSTGSRAVVVAVIDEGIDFNHVDLAANMWTNPGEIPGNGIDDDGNGFVDDVHGFDFHNNRGNVFSAADGDLHGTHVAGTIGAVGNNATGVVGVNWQTSLMSLKFLGPDGGFTSNAIQAVNYATMMRTNYGVSVRVTNNSWGGGGFVQGLLDAINAGGAADILFVAAAGNDGRNTDTTPSYPASYTSPYIVSVAATDRRDALASFSNFGFTSVDLGAPGVNILSTVPSNGYGSLSGTSMAAPHVAGAAALALSVDPTLSVTDLRNLLLTTTDPVPALAGKTVTGGRLNANSLVRALGLTVTETSPAVGSVVNTAPTSFTITFRNAFDPATLAATDLTVNGIAATSATLVDPVTARFDFATSPVTASGEQVMSLAAGALERAGDGAPLRAFTGTFRFDPSPLSVVGTLPAAASVVLLPLAAIDVEFDDDVAAASVGTGDLVVSQGSVTSATLISSRVVRYGLAGVTKEAVLAFSLPAGAVTDAVGNPSLPYAGTLSLDIDTVAVATPLEPVVPLGGLIYRGTQTGLLSGADDEDAFTLAINAGQSLAVAVTPAAGVAATVTLRDPAGNETTSAPSAPGVAAIAGPASATAAGTWTIIVANGGAASGTYAIEMLIDAAFEVESLGGGANDTPASAQPIDASLITIASASRAAVVGRIGSPGESDMFSLDIDAGRRVSIVVASAADVPLALSLVGPSGAVVATGTTAATLQAVIDGVVVPSAGTYRIEVTGGDVADYGLVAIVGGRIGIEPDDSLATADAIEIGDVVLAHVGAPWESVENSIEITGSPVSLGFDAVGDFGGPTIGQVWNGVEFHWFSTFTLAIAGTNYNNSWFFDFNPTPFPVSLSRHRDGTADFVRITGEPQPGVVFERLVRRRDGDDHVTITTTVKNLTGSALSGVALLESQNPDPRSEWYTANDVTLDGRLVVASIDGASLGLGSNDPRAVASAEGRVFGGYAVGDPFDVLLSPADPDGAVDDIAINVAFDIGTLAPGAETSCTFVMVFGESQAVVEAGFAALDIRPAVANVLDVYRVALPADHMATITALTPAAGGASADGPDLRLELLTASGTVLATADGTAGVADATLTHLVDATGEYFVSVSVVPGSSARAGSYALSVTTNSSNAAPTALALLPDAVTLPENTPLSTRLRLADIAVTDDGFGTLSFAVTGPDATVFEADATGLYLRAGTVLDFERQSVHAVTVVVSDPTLPDAPALSATFTLTVTDVNEPPTSLVLLPSALTLPENTPLSTRLRLADIAVADDALGTLAFAVTGPDAALFEADATGLYLRAGTVLDFERQSVHAVTVVVSDPTLPGTPALSATFTLTVTDVNEPPTSLVLRPDAAALPEHTPLSTRLRLADIAVTDDAIGTLTFSLTGPDAAVFEADATGLYLRAGTVLDFERQSVHAVTVVVSDPSLPGVPALSATFTLNVTDVNEPPTSLVLLPGTLTLPENTPLSTRLRLADIAVTDDALGTLAFALTGPDAAVFEADATGLYLRAGTVLDFERQSVHAVTVVVSDPTLPGAPALSATFTLTVTDVNEPPTNLSLVGASIAENNDVGAVVGTFTAADPDVGDAITYELVAGEGAEGNAAFVIDGSRLLAAERFNFEVQNRYSIRVRATDAAGASTEAVFVIDVIDDETEPLDVESVTLPAAGTYRAGQSLLVTVGFSRAVVVRGVPTLQLRLGGRLHDAVYSGGSGSTVLTFKYRVVPGDAATGLALGPGFEFSRRAAIVADGSRVPVNLPARFRSLVASDVIVDGRPPKIVGRVGMPRAGTYLPGQTLVFTVRFSEAVVVEGVPRIRLFIGSAMREAEYVGGAGSRVLRFEYTVPDVTGRRRSRPVELGQRIVGGQITDLAGNPSQRELTEPRASRVKVVR